MSVNSGHNFSQISEIFFIHLSPLWFRRWQYYNDICSCCVLLFWMLIITILYWSLTLWNVTASSRRFRRKNHHECSGAENSKPPFSQHLPWRSQTVANLSRMIAFMSDVKSWASPIQTRHIKLLPNCPWAVSQLIFWTDWLLAVNAFATNKSIN